MATATYMFADTPDDVELERLQTQERAYDWVSQGKLLDLGLKAGDRCLETRVGAGSMLRWIADVVGPDGHVTGVDIDPRYFEHSRAANVTLQEGDLLTGPLDLGAFDAIHARLLFLHLAPKDRVDLLARFAECLRPGGWLVALDPDLRLRFPSANLRATELQAQLLDAFLQVLGHSPDYTIGSRLPHLFADAGLELVESMAVLPRFTPPTRSAAFGDVHARAQRNTYLAVRRVVEAAGAMNPTDLDEFFALFDAGEVDHNFAAFLTWGRRPIPAQ